MSLDRLLRRISWKGWFALAAAPRIVLALKLGNRLYQADETGIDSGSWLVAQTLRLGRPEIPGMTSPVTTSFFGSFYALFGHFPLAPRLAQALVGAATVCFIGRMTEDLSDSPRAGRLAAVTAAAYPFFIYYSAILMTETLYIAFVTLGLWWWTASLRERGRSPRLAAGGGFMIGMAALCRVEAAPIALVLFAMAAIAAARGRWSWRAWAAAALCWLIPLFGWAARNKVRYDSFTLDAHGGTTLLHGTLLYELCESMDTGDAMRVLATMPFYQDALKLPPGGRERALFRAAEDFMRENPGETAWQWARKFKSFWRFYPRVDKVYVGTAGTQPGLGLGRWLLVVVSLLFEPWLIVLGWLGLWEMRRRPGTWLPVFYVLGTMGVHVIVVSMMRYRLPVMPVMILGACSWIAARQDNSRMADS